jgi:hypothetical protein
LAFAAERQVVRPTSETTEMIELMSSNS